MLKDLLAVFFNALAETCDRIAIVFEEPAEEEDGQEIASTNGRHISVILHDESEEHHHET